MMATLRPASSGRVSYDVLPERALLHAPGGVHPAISVIAMSYPAVRPPVPPSSATNLCPQVQPSGAASQCRQSVPSGCATIEKYCVSCDWSQLVTWYKAVVNSLVP
ncbi:unnamed protein product, partial [Staurois parvus]